MTSYFVGDVPAEDIVIEPARAGIAIDLEPFSSASITFRGPDGAEVLSAGFMATILTETVTIEWPNETILDSPGVYELMIVLEGLHAQETLSPERIVVEVQGSGWYTLDLARTDWLDAPEQDISLHNLLEAAKTEILAWAPALSQGELPPYNWRKAQLMHARTLWNADKADTNSGQIGFDSFAIPTPKALEKNTRAILRPKTPNPVIG